MATLNTDPVYPKEPDVQVGAGVLGPSANTAQDGTGSNITSIWQADDTNGGFLWKLLLNSVGSPVATVLRVYLCSVTGTFTPGTSNTASNTTLVAELSLPAVTVSQTVNGPAYPLNLNLPVPPGYRILVAFGTSTGSAGTGWVVVPVGAKF